MSLRFSVLEALIVVVIIGVLANLAIPTTPHSDIIQSEVNERVALVDNLTVRISSYAQANQRLPDNIDAEYFRLPASNPYAIATVESVTWYPKQLALLVAFKPHPAFGNGKYIVFSATGTLDNLQWQCGNKHPLIGDQAMPSEYLPKHCRTTPVMEPPNNRLRSWFDKLITNRGN